MVSGGNVRVVFVTCASLTEARRIAKALIRKRLAACVSTILGPVQSIYRWKDKVETTREHLLIIKTSKKCLPQVEKDVKRWHSYDVPEFLVLSVSAASREYLQWIHSSLE